LKILSDRHSLCRQKNFKQQSLCGLKNAMSLKKFSTLATSPCYYKNTFTELNTWPNFLLAALSKSKFFFEKSTKKNIFKRHRLCRKKMLKSNISANSKRFSKKFGGVTQGPQGG